MTVRVGGADAGAGVGVGVGVGWAAVLPTRHDNVRCVARYDLQTRGQQVAHPTGEPTHGYYQLFDEMPIQSGLAGVLADSRQLSLCAFRPHAKGISRKSHWLGGTQ